MTIALSLLILWVLGPRLLRSLAFVLAIPFVVLGLLIQAVGRRLERSGAERSKEERIMVKAKGLVGRRVSYQVDENKAVGGTIQAVHNHLDQRRLFVKWDDGERDSFIFANHPLLTIHD